MANWQVGFYPKARNDLLSLDKPNRRQVVAKLDWLAKNFEKVRHEPLHTPLDGHYKLRIGKIRAVYMPNYKTATIEVEYIDFRDKAYK